VKAVPRSYRIPSAACTVAVVGTDKNERPNVDVRIKVITHGFFRCHLRGFVTAPWRSDTLFRRIAMSDCSLFDLDDIHASKHRAAIICHDVVKAHY